MKDIKFKGIYYHKKYNRLLQVRGFNGDKSVSIGSLCKFHGDAETVNYSFPVSLDFFKDCLLIDKGLDEYDFLEMDEMVNSFRVKEDKPSISTIKEMENNE